MNNIPILRLAGVLLTTLQTDLRDDVADQFRNALLARISEFRCNGLLIDISSMEIVDTYVARVLADTARMAQLMGTRTVLVGMRPEVASTLVQMGYELEDIETALDVEQGLTRLGYAITRMEASR